MSTRWHGQKPIQARDAGQIAGPGLSRRARDARFATHGCIETIAVVTRAKRELLLRVHRHRLSREDLEDCYSQTTLELIARARRGPGFRSPEHIASALDRRLLSRIQDRRRALAGRSPIEAALARALPLHGAAERGPEPLDLRIDVQELVCARQDLRRICELAARGLSPDQRLVLASQLAEDMSCAEFCERHGWSAEKYRKVAQRARLRLRELMSCPARRGPSD